MMLNEARWEIARSVAWGRGEEPPPRDDGAAILDYLQTKAPPVYDPFCGGGSIPLEAQRLGLTGLWLGPQPGGGADLQGAGRDPAEVRRSPAGAIPRCRAAQAISQAPRASPRTCATTANGCATRPSAASAISIRRRSCPTAVRRRSSPGCGRARCARPTRAPTVRWCRWSRPSCSRRRRAGRPGSSR